jgi:hypothetical protein
MQLNCSYLGSFRVALHWSTSASALLRARARGHQRGQTQRGADQWQGWRGSARRIELKHSPPGRPSGYQLKEREQGGAGVQTCGLGSVGLTSLPLAMALDRTDALTTSAAASLCAGCSSPASGDSCAPRPHNHDSRGAIQRGDQHDPGLGWVAGLQGRALGRVCVMPTGPKYAGQAYVIRVCRSFLSIAWQAHQVNPQTTPQASSSDEEMSTSDHETSEALLIPLLFRTTYVGHILRLARTSGCSYARRAMTSCSIASYVLFLWLSSPRIGARLDCAKCTACSILSSLQRR